MGTLEQLFLNNRQWSARRTADDPGFFTRLSKQQSPRYLWIGCADSRVPANEIVGLEPGEVFVHRNVANLVVHTDLNCLSVIEFAVDVLGVEDIMVVGHYGCGGVGLALAGRRPGLADSWLRHVDDVRDRHAEQLDAIDEYALAHDRLCELNVIEQVANVCRTSIIRSAWSQGKRLSVHGWIYGLHDGLLRDLGVSVNSAESLRRRYQEAILASSSGQHGKRRPSACCVAHALY